MISLYTWKYVPFLESRNHLDYFMVSVLLCIETPSYFTFLVPLCIPSKLNIDVTK